jgi:hypothetical protein
MANAEDLKIRIPITPSQESLFPEIIERLNAEPDMMMDRIELQAVTWPFAVMTYLI